MKAADRSTMTTLNAFELTGRTRSHICHLENPECELHRGVAAAWENLRRAAGEEGFDLTPYSAFRDFEAQVRIWNDKYDGRRPLYDRDGTPLDRGILSESELVDRILYWSALPGGSRHHWGSDLDVIDAAAIGADYQVRLMPEEYGPGGVFHRLKLWLDNHLESFGFFRPYAEEQGGVSAEPWHISFLPVAESALDALSVEILEEAIRASSIRGESAILDALPRLYEQYVTNIVPPDAKGP